MTQTKEVDGVIQSSHRPLDLAIIAVLAGIVIYYFVTYTLSAAGGGYLVWICVAALIGTTVAFLGHFYWREGEIDVLRLQTLEIAARSKARDRRRLPDEESQLKD